MTDNSPFIHTSQHEIDDLHEQATLLPPGRNRNLVLAREDALQADDGF